MKLLHFADLHLDAPFAWAEPHVARLRRDGQRRTLDRIVALGTDQRVDAILCGGDLFEQDRVEPDTVEYLRRVFADAGRPVYLAPGNHDWYGPTSPYLRTRWTPNVRVFTEDHLVPVELAPGLRLWGAAHCAPANTPDFFAGFCAEGTAVNLVLAHASERGLIASEARGKLPHAPFEADELERTGINLALLGHYHRPRDEVRFSYPGNPDPLEFGEDGERGVLLVTIDQSGAFSRQRRTVAASEVHDKVVDVGGAQDRNEVATRVRDAIAGLDGAVRVTLCGELGSTVQLEPGTLQALGHGLEGFVVQIHVKYAYDLSAIANEKTVRGQFVRDVLQQIEDEALRQRVITTGLRALDGRSDLEVV